MPTFKIEGGHRLKGSILPQGAKNEALQVICAVLLTDEPVKISNIPDIADVNKLIELLRDLGVKVTPVAKGEVVFEAKNINIDYLESTEFRKKGSSIRGSIMIMGPLLARMHSVAMPKPGGDKIWRRRLDTHFFGFIKLGASFDYSYKDGFYRMFADELRGSYMHLD